MQGKINKISLIGHMGCGKTTVGTLLQRKLGYSFIDSDAAIEEQLELSVSEIFRQFGEEYFRQQESKTINRILEAKQASILATGGGAILNPQTCSKLQQHSYVVFLDATPSTLYARLAKNNSRPLLEGENKLELIQQKFIERQDIYVSTAHHSIKIDELTPEQIADKIVSCIAQHK